MTVREIMSALRRRWYIPLAVLACGALVTVMLARDGGVFPTTPPATATPNATPTPTAIPTSTPTPPPPPPSGGFPTRESAGLPDGWEPAREVTGDYWIREAGAVIEDVRFTNGTIYVDAPNVTLRRIQAVGASVINDYNNVCKNGLLIEDSEFTANGPTSDADLPPVGTGGYTVRNIVIDGLPEGLRVGGEIYGCSSVQVERSFIRIAPPDICNDWHGDGIQGYGGTHVVVRQTTIIMDERPGCYGTAPFFYPSGQGNTSVDIDGLIVSGGGYSFRNGMPGPIKNLNIVDGGWGYGPVDVNCGVVSTWQAQAVTLDAVGQPVPVRSITCSGGDRAWGTDQ